MNQTIRIYFLVLLLGLTTFRTAVASSGQLCADSTGFAATIALAGSDSADEVKYAPDRKVDIQHVALDVTPDFDKRSIKGEAVLTFSPIAKPLEEIKLDGVDLNVSDVKCTAQIANYQVTDKQVIITFAQPILPGAEAKLSIRYCAIPEKGLYFRVPSNGYRAEGMHLFSQGEMIEARHWFPCYDYPNEKFTSEVTCHVPAGMTVVSNGRQISAQKDADGLLAVHWLQDKPHVNYLITLAAGYFTKLEDKCKDIQLSFYFQPQYAKEAPLTFADTKYMMDFYNNEIGVPFPWAQYGQVVVQDFHYGGMENTSLTTLGDVIFRSPDAENVQVKLGPFTSENVVAHELAHQWFGDLVTCKDWSHAWLNEGFATYYTLLYSGFRYGKDEMLYGLFKDKSLVLSEREDSRPVVFRRYDEPVEQFDQRAYQKSSWVLQMLRCQLGDDLFRKCVRSYLERFKFQTVVTADLSKVIEEMSGRSFDRFFDQWIYHSGHPDLAISYSWDEQRKLAKISVSQQQKISDPHGEQFKRGGVNHHSDSSNQSKMVNVFRFPLTLRFKCKGETVERQVDVEKSEDSFYVPLKCAPEIVRVDPDLGLLAKIDIDLPNAMLQAQLDDKTDMMGRILAVEQLASKKDEATVNKLKGVLQNDEFYGVRIEAAASLRKIHTDQALQALIDAVRQKDARVRKAVVMNVARFFHPQAKDCLLKCLDDERNPAVIVEALRGLGSYHQPEVHDVLLKFLHTPSFHNMIALGAIEAIRDQDDPSYVKPLCDELSNHIDDFTSEGFSTALDALAYIERNEKQRDDVRNFIAAYLNNKREAFQLAAMRSLGTLEDPKSIAILNTFASSAKDSPQHQTAEWSIATLRHVNKPNDNLKDLRQELLDLQKASRDQRKEIDDLKKLLKADQSKNKSDKKGAPEPTKKTSTSRPSKRV